MANYKNRKPKSHKGHCGMCCLRTTDGRRNGRKPSMQERRADAHERDAREYVSDWPWDVCGGEWICEGCFEGMGLAECDEHPWLAAPEPLRVKFAEVA